MRSVNILIAGVGGQGVILASDLVAEVALSAGYDVKKSDSIGMAQRGGSVVSHVRFSEKVFSPLISEGGADFLLAFEELEAARWASYLKPQGMALVADVVLPPLTVIGSKSPYPAWDGIKKILGQLTGKVYLVPVSAIARELDDPRALNMVMLGFLSAFLGMEKSLWEEKIRGRLSPRFISAGLAAFLKGGAEGTKIVAKEGYGDA
ncbi:MAG: 2-oxoacid:acceptor oxidoreductase family protein [Chloroflexota bacterium]